MHLGEYIKEYRTSHGDMSQDAFAKISGLSKGYISMLERNENPKTKLPIAPTIDTYQKVANAVGVSLNELFTYVDSSIDLNTGIPLPAAPDPEEERLTGLYRQLNTEGREKLVDYADDLVSSGKYIKSDSARPDQKQA